MLRDLATFVASAILACGGRNDYAGAAVTAGMAVAAAGAYRGATDGCWADCMPGFECDEPTGTCVASPCKARCKADYRCVWVDGKQQCVLPAREGVGQLEPVQGGRHTDKETNQALCLVAGIMDCPRRPHTTDAADSNSMTRDRDVDIISGGAR